MFRNYFKTAIRNLLRYKGFALINIASLTLGIIGCLVIGLFVWDERQFDKHVPEGEQIYRVYEERKDITVTTYGAPVPPAYATFLDRTYPEVDTTTRILMTGDRFLMEVGEKSAYQDKGVFVDPSFFHLFRLPFLKGDPATALNSPLSLVLTEELAKHYFGAEDPIGKSVFIDKDTFEVKGVVARFPEHFHLQFRYLMPMSSSGIEASRFEDWGWHQVYTYVKLKPSADVAQLQQKFQAHIRKEIFPTLSQEGSSFMPFFQPLKDIHLKSSDFIYDNAVRGNESYVKGLTLIAFFVLVIACFNFINLATARSFRRAKEIGVRKVIGAGRQQLVFQFISETVFLSLLSMILATVATMLIVPSLNAFTGKSISFNPFSSPLLGLLILLAGVVIGILAGIYPAMVLSGFQPIKVIKNAKPATSGGGGWLRPALVIVQFTLSVLLIVSAIIVYRQTQYLNNKDLGFSKEQVIYFQIRNAMLPKLETFKDELRQHSGVLSVTSGYGLPGDQFAGDGVSVPTKEGVKDFSSKVFIGDHDYVKTLGLKVIAGRDFSRQIGTDEREGFLINESAVKEFGFGSPEKAVGQPMYWNEWEPADTLNKVKKGKVIGVVQDFHYTSLHEKVTASVIQIYPAVTFKVAAKLKTAEISGTLAYINNLWAQYATGYPLDYKFMDETYGKMYGSEEKLSRLLWIFTLVAILVGCMGLFGLAALSAEQRTKEIGIRKVLGADVFNIVSLLARNFLVFVLIACLIAFPLSWWALHNWLEDFPYRVSISWWVFLVALVAALLVAFITVSIQSIRAATANPVKSLRTE